MAFFNTEEEIMDYIPPLIKQGELLEKTRDAIALDGYGHRRGHNAKFVHRGYGRGDGTRGGRTYSCCKGDCARGGCGLCAMRDGA